MTKPSEQRTSASLLGRLSTDPGNAAAWAEFVQRYGRMVLEWCRHWGCQEADAEDVTQNVLLNVAQRMQRFVYDPGRRFRGWLRTVAHAAWCDWQEAQRRPGHGSGDSQVVALLASVEARDDLLRRLEEQYDTELLELALARVQVRVEPHTWEAFRLLAFDGLTGADVAARLGMKVGTVFVARSKVQKMVQEEVGKLEEGG